MTESVGRDRTVEDYTWITGEKRGVVHVRKIGSGATGDVHKVRTRNLFPAIDRCLRC
jgi:hypothetical protein